MSYIGNRAELPAADLPTTRATKHAVAAGRGVVLGHIRRNYTPQTPHNLYTRPDIERVGFRAKAYLSKFSVGTSNNHKEALYNIFVAALKASDYNTQIKTIRRHTSGDCIITFWQNPALQDYVAQGYHAISVDSRTLQVPIGAVPEGNINYSRYRITVCIPVLGCLQDVMTAIEEYHGIPREVLVDTTLSTGEETGANFAVNSRYIIYAQFPGPIEAVNLPTYITRDGVFYKLYHRGGLQCPICGEKHTAKEHTITESKKVRSERPRTDQATQQCVQ